MEVLHMAGAYYEKIARINLTTGKIKVEPLDLDLAHKFIGGRGLGTKMLYDEGIATVDPLSPENKLIYITGPMTGAAAPSTGRYMVCTKSPLTGMIACSNSGGIWGAKLKYAGWDAIIVEGEAPDWTYINIDDDKIELLDAREYVGVMSEAIDEQLKAKHGADVSVLNIGPAGEKKVLLAAIMNDKDRAAGRSGVGAVMGSKKLKAIVVKATRNCRPGCPEGGSQKRYGCSEGQPRYRFRPAATGYRCSREHCQQHRCFPHQELAGELLRQG